MTELVVVLKKKFTALERLRMECDRESAQWILDMGFAKFKQLCERDQFLIEAFNKAEEKRNGQVRS